MKEAMSRTTRRRNLLPLVVAGSALAAALLAGCGGRDGGPNAPRGRDSAPGAAGGTAAAKVAMPAPTSLPVASSPPAPSALTADSESAPAPAAASAAPAVSGARLATGERRLFHAASSIEDLVRQVLAAVEAEDMQGLTDLRVTEREHNELLWPEFPARDHNVQLDFAWDMLNTRSHTNQGRAIGTWRGKGLEFVAVRFEREIERYRTFVAHRGTVVTARTAAGEEVEVRFIGSILELDGQFKVVSYKDRD